jgi:hypothetical protein
MNLDKQIDLQLVIRFCIPSAESPLNHQNPSTSALFPGRDSSGKPTAA